MAITCIVAGGRVAHAQALQGDPKNAATWYARAISKWQQFREAYPQQAELIANYAGDPAQPITPEIRAALSSVQGVLSDYRRAAQEEFCDFELDYSQGFELMMPHLAEMRGISRAMRSDAAIKMADGDSAAAAATLATMYRSSGHFGDDRVLISSLVGQAVFGFADAGVQLALDNGTLTAADAASLLNGAKTLSINDPFQYVEAQAMEQEIALASLEKYRTPEGMQTLIAMMGVDPEDSEVAKEIGALDDAGFATAMEQYDAVMTKMSEAFAIPDKDAALAAATEINDAIARGEFGALAKVLAPAHVKILETKFKGEQMLRDRIATLEKLASGDYKPEELANAAIWYLRAIEMWEALPPESRTAMLNESDTSNAKPREGSSAHAAATAPAATDDASVLLAQPQVKAIIDTVREASLKRRCDFASATPKAIGPPPVAPFYAPGMHELAGLMLRDAERFLLAGQQEDAIDRLAIALRMTAHMGSDAHLSMCRAAHVRFIDTLDMVEAHAQQGRLDLHQPLAVALSDAAGRVSRQDPFGYVKALTATRQALALSISFIAMAFEPELRERFDTQSPIIAGFNADQTMFALVLLDERMRRMIANPPPQREGQRWQPHDITQPESIERLTGVFDVDAVRSVQQQGDELIPRINAMDWEFFVVRQATPAASLTMGLTRARADLRRATRLLLLLEDEELADN